MYRQAIDAGDYLAQRSTWDLRTGCWNFTGPRDKDGYGQVQHSRCGRELKVTRAHQMSYSYYQGSIPAGMCVLHKCDNPPCINPSHLFLGTNNDNVQDMMMKGRNKAGRTTKITDEERKEIMSLKGTKTSMEVAAEFNISFSRVCQIWRGE